MRTVLRAGAICESEQAIATLIDMWPLRGLPRIDFLGIYPTRESIIAQVATASVLLVGFWYTRRVSRPDR